LSRNDATASAIDSVGVGLNAYPNSEGRLPDGSHAIGQLTETPGLPNAAPNALVFTLQPVGGAALVGEPFSFYAFAANATSLQWHRNGTPIPLATGSELAFSSVSVADDATYSCVATNAGGSISSQPARLDVLEMWAMWAARHGVIDPGGDPDGDGAGHHIEFLAGTDPLAPTSSRVLPSGGASLVPGSNRLFIDLLISPRAAYSDIVGEISLELQPPWDSAYPDSIEVLDVSADGSRRTRYWFAAPAGADRAFLRARLDP
jgi:hypothetical protein